MLGVYIYVPTFEIILCLAFLESMFSSQTPIDVVLNATALLFVDGLDELFAEAFGLKRAAAVSMLFDRNSPKLVTEAVDFTNSDDRGYAAVRSVGRFCASWVLLPVHVALMWHAPTTTSSQQQQREARIETREKPAGKAHQGGSVNHEGMVQGKSNIEGEGTTCGQLPAPVTSQTQTPPFETRIAAFESESCVKKDARGY